MYQNITCVAQRQSDCGENIVKFSIRAKIRHPAQDSKMDLRCVITAISVLLPACGAKSLNSPIISNYSTSANISSSPVVPTPLVPPLTRPPAPRSSSKGNKENTIHDNNLPPSASFYSLHDRVNGVAFDNEFSSNLSSGSEQQRTLSDSSCLVGLPCDQFSLTPPPDVFNLVPPPPFPLFLFELELWPNRDPGVSNWGLQMKKFNFRSYYVLQREENEEGAIVVRINPEWLSASDHQECSFCNWATNESLQPLFTFMPSPQAKVDGMDYWYETVFGVSLLSAAIGACLTCAFLKLHHINRTKTTHEEVKGEPVHQTNTVHEETFRERATHHCAPFKSRQTHLDKKWTHQKETGSIIRHQSPSLHWKEEISEDLYINTNAPSDTDSELTTDKNYTVSEDSTRYPSVSTISSDVSSSACQICDPLCLLAMKGTVHTARLPIIENYASDRSRFECSSSPLKASLPPLSYSSDEFVCKIVPRKKRKKRKGDFNTIKEHLGGKLKEVPETLNVRSLEAGELISNLEPPVLNPYSSSLQDSPRAWCIHTHDSKSHGSPMVLPSSSTQYMASLNLRNCPAAMSINKQFYCSPSRHYFDNLAFNSAKANKYCNSGRTLLPFENKLPPVDSAKVNFNPYMYNNDEQNCYQMEENILRGARCIFPHLHQLKTSNPCILDYEIYKEYSSSEVPTEYI